MGASTSTSKKRKTSTPPAGSSTKTGISALATGLATLEDALHQLRKAGAEAWLWTDGNEMAILVRADLPLGRSSDGHLTIDGKKAVEL